MAAIRSFRDLEVYKLGLDESKKIFLLTKSFPAEERFALVDQIRDGLDDDTHLLLSARPTKLWVKQWRRRPGWTMLLPAATSVQNAITSWIKPGNT